MPRASLVVPYVCQGLELGLRAHKVVMVEGIPYCLLRGYEQFVSEAMIPDTRIYEAQCIIPNFTQVRRKDCKSKGPRCHTCIFDGPCEGPWREYPDRYGWQEFVPITRKI